MRLSGYGVSSLPEFASPGTNNFCKYRKLIPARLAAFNGLERRFNSVASTTRPCIDATKKNGCKTINQIRCGGGGHSRSHYCGSTCGNSYTHRHDNPVYPEQPTEHSTDHPRIAALRDD